LKTTKIGVEGAQAVLAPGEAADDSASPARCDAMRILLVEDVPLNQELASTILRRAGHFVHIANDGLEAVAAAEGNSYDVILMDIRMPRLDGVNAARRIRSLPGPAGQTPIVAVTADALPELVRGFVRQACIAMLPSLSSARNCCSRPRRASALEPRPIDARNGNRMRRMIRFFFPIR
jgi:CheY-like chemotaxis protein